jgi:hypothetical protein
MAEPAARVWLYFTLTVTIAVADAPSDPVQVIE